MTVTAEFNSISKILSDRGLEDKGKIQRNIDSEVLRLCKPYVPMDAGTLIASGNSNTVLGSGEVQYNTPYARRWYYTAANFAGAPMRGTYWFERMKNNGGAKSILAGVKNMLGVS